MRARPQERQAAVVVTGRRRRFRPGGTLVVAVLVVAAIIWLIPFAWAIATSLKPDPETTKVPVSWTGSTVTLGAYNKILDRGEIFRWYFNSALVSVVVTALTILLSSMAAFAFSRVRFRGRGALFALIAAGLIVPFQALIVPLCEEMDTFGLVDTYWAIILPQVASPIAVLVYKRFVDGIPDELEDSALVDGAGPWRIYWRIWMPLARPATAAVGIFTFVLSWNNFIWPFVVTTARSLQTIPVGLSTVNSFYGAQYAQVMAPAILGALPLLIAFLFFQRQIVQGISNTGLKG
ncbi:MAG: carbohydrate ABC transporter permease [Solirubrobacteraceae bacterium]